MSSGFSPVAPSLIPRSTLATDFPATLRRLRIGKSRSALVRRPESELRFIGAPFVLSTKILYDTTVYVDILQGRFPADADLMLLLTDAWHSTLTESELAVTCGLLDPAHAGTAAVIREVTALIGRRPQHRTIAPDAEIWRDAGLLSGLLARTQGYGKEQRLPVLNDALLFATARKHGCTVLTRNIADFDFLQQLEPTGRVVFYRV